MAIDTKNEKLALINLLQPFNTPVPDSSDGLGQDDKQHLLWAYPGILWTEAVSIRAFGDSVLSIASKLGGSVSIEAKLQGTLGVEPKLEGDLSINE